MAVKKNISRSDGYFLSQKYNTEGGISLGIDYSPQETKFAVWSPRAKKVDLIIYDKQDTLKGEGQVFEMKQNDIGIWKTKVLADQKNKYYHYRVELDDKINYAVDPYAKAVSVNGKRGAIIDLEDTNPRGWQKDRRPVIGGAENSIIYELHIRDFSISPFSGMENKGEYTAFAEEGTTIPDTAIKTGIEHLKDLGITHVHLMPIFDFATVDESTGYQYNWGYDPLHYNVPEGSYASDAFDPIKRIKELKKLIKALHDNGIRVVMDVVYNHTYSVYDSPFGKLAPKEYYRYNYFGHFSNGSGCGNEIASEQTMVRKLIVDSVVYWAKEYHIDGFRCDLMALHDIDTMELVAKRLHDIDSDILIYGEPWKADYTPLADEKQMKKGDQQNTGVGVFNDDLRDAIKGETRGGDKGYATGKITPETVGIVQEGIRGATCSFAASPMESINYVSCHDDLTLWDKIAESHPNLSEQDRIKMNNLCSAILLTSQGIPFLHGGVEFLRTKHGIENSYSHPDGINQLKWERKAENYKVYEYHKGLIKLRKEHPAFRMSSNEMIRKHLEFFNVSNGMIAFRLKGNANGDSWKDIVVIHNPHWESKRVFLPFEAEWKFVVSNQIAGTYPLKIRTAESISVAKISTTVLYRD